MNRRQKIIVSVVGIFIVLLALVGLTYAYFLTQVKGNTNNKSISVTTANLRLVYGGDDGSIIGDNEIIEPDTTFAPKTFTVSNEGNEKIDSYAVVIENFGVYYNEDSTIIENNVEVPVYANDVTKLSRPEDFEIVIECENQNGEECTGYSGALPTESAIMLTNSIEKDEVQTYKATITYKEAGTNQSADMNKRIEGKFNIIGLSDTVDLTGTVSSYQKGDYVQTNSTKRVSAINPDGTYKVLGLEAGTHKIKVCAVDPLHPEVKDCADEDAKLIQEISIVKGETASGNNTTKTITITEDSREATVNVNVTNSSVTIEEEVKDIEKPTLLVDAIINRAKSITESDSKTNGYAMYSTTLRTTPGESASAADESLLLTTEDDYTQETNKPSYYFRGNVKDNYVNFSGMCWRIVRIQGDGTIKLTLADEDNECNSSGYSVDAADSSAIKHANFDMDDEFSQKVASYSGGLLDFKETYIPTILDTWSKKDNNALNTTKLESNAKWCNDIKVEKEKYYDSSFKEIDGTDTNLIAYTDLYYAAYFRIKNNQPSLKCEIEDEDKYVNYIGLLTSDEYFFAGAGKNREGTSYLKTNATGMQQWTMTPLHFFDDANFAFIVRFAGGDLNVGPDDFYDSGNSVQGDGYIRPAIILKNDVTLSANTSSTQIGTYQNPYVID